jgi:hypothetical protein
LGGTFNEPGEGSIEVDHFSAFGVIGKKKSYYFGTYYIPKEPNVYEAHVTVTTNLQLRLKEVKDKYAGKEEGESACAQIQEKDISLDIQPHVGVREKIWEKDGWELTLIEPTKLQKGFIDEPGKEIPHFSIGLKLLDVSNPQRLIQKVGFVGTELQGGIIITRDSQTEDHTKTTPLVTAPTAAASHDTQPTSTSSPTGQKTGKLDLDRDDVNSTKTALQHLEKEELKDLFQELGLSDLTARNKYTKSIKAYAEDLIRGWILGRDNVTKSAEYPGGATWENLRKALRKMEHHGIAERI